MEIGFFSKRVVPGASFAALALPEIDNPFCTDAYLSALQKQGDKCWIVGTHAGDVVEGLAVALLRRGRLSNTLEIPSLPEAAQDQTFWDGVYSLCRQLSVADT